MMPTLFGHVGTKIEQRVPQARGEDRAADRRALAQASTHQLVACDR